MENEENQLTHDIRIGETPLLYSLQLHVGQEQADPASDARAVPIYATTSYVFHNSQHAADRFALKDAGNIYGRLTNSTQDVFEKRIAALEGGVAALGLASGAAAISYTIQALARAGENILLPRQSTAEHIICWHIPCRFMGLPLLLLTPKMKPPLSVPSMKRPKLFLLKHSAILIPMPLILKKLPRLLMLMVFRL